MKELAVDIGVRMTTADIIDSHRMLGRPGTAKSIIAKFVRRDMKASVMRNKRKLREHDRRRSVYINEDLTQGNDTIRSYGACRLLRVRVNRKVARMYRTRETQVKRNYSPFSSRFCDTSSASTQSQHITFRHHKQH